ncbi:MAG: hypothetical protein ACOX08_10690 [Methanobacterium sp.]
MIKNAFEKGGLIYLLKKGPNFVFKQISNFVEYYIIIYPFKRDNFFVFNNTKYHYFYHYHNPTWKNERTIEVPIIMEKVKKTNGNILELGNVLSNYFNFEHDILDKYDKFPNVINEDVVDFVPNYKYDLIVSISTLEHVGWDEPTRDPEKVLVALKKMKKWLVKGGELIFTVPIGHNTYLDQLFKDDNIKCTEIFYLKRTSNTEWIETTWDDIKDTQYNHPLQFANGIIVGIFKNKKR